MGDWIILLCGIVVGGVGFAQLRAYRNQIDDYEASDRASRLGPVPTSFMDDADTVPDVAPYRRYLH